MSKTWQEGKLGELIDLQTGFPFKSEQYTGESEDVRLLRGDNIIPGGLRWDNVQRWSNQDLDDYRHYWLQDGDLVIAMDRPWVNAGLKYARIEKWDLPSLLVQRVARLRANHNADAGFLYHIVGSYQFTQYLLSEQTGTSVPHISAKQICDYIFPLPPLPEQRKIAEILSTWDEAIALTGALIAALQTRKRALMQLLLTGQVRFPGFDGEWEEVRIGDVVTTFSGGTPSRTRSDYFGGNIAWIKSGEINQVNITSTEESITEAGLHNSSARIVEKNTLLLALYGATAGKVGFARIEAAINQALLALIPHVKVLDKGYLFYELQNQMGGILRKLQGGQPNLSAQLVNESYISLPELKEQQKISDALVVCDEEITIWNHYCTGLQTQKRGLMQQLLTGTVRVRV